MEGFGITGEEEADLPQLLSCVSRPYKPKTTGLVIYWSEEMLSGRVCPEGERKKKCFAVCFLSDVFPTNAELVSLTPYLAEEITSGYRTRHFRSHCL